MSDEQPGAEPHGPTPIAPGASEPGQVTVLPKVPRDVVLVDSSADSITSIIMPVFKEHPYRLLRAIDSVLKQTDPHWELILISDDGTDYESLLSDALHGDRRFRFTSTGAVGAGPSAARNIALAIAHGDIVAFLDSDDFMEPEKLAVMAPLARGYGMVIDNSRYGFENGEGHIGTYCPGEPSAYHALPFFLAIAWPLIPVYDRRRFPDARFAEDIRFAEDMLFNFEMLLHNGGGYFVGEPLHNYVIRPISMSHGPDAGQRADVSYNRIIDTLTERQAPSVLIDAMDRKRKINRQYLDWLRWEHGSFHEFIHALKASERDGFVAREGECLPTLPGDGVGRVAAMG